MVFDELNKSEKQENKSNIVHKKDPLNEDLRLNSQSQKTIFILEDFLPTINFYKRLLTKYSLKTTTTVADAIKEINVMKESGIKVDLMISDYNLPDGTSEKAIEYMKECFPEVKVILVSGNIEAEGFVKTDKFISKEHLVFIKDEVEKFL